MNVYAEPLHVEKVGVSVSPTRPDTGERALGAEGVRYPGPSLLLAVWSVVAVLASSRFAFAHGSSAIDLDPSLVVAYIACFAPWAGLSPLAFRLEQRYPLGTTGWIGNAARLAAVSVPFSLVSAFLMPAAASIGWYVTGRPTWFLRNPLAWLRDFPVSEVCFWCSVAAGYVIRTQAQLRGEERRAARLALEKSQLEAGLNQAQLEVLRAKLNPHFLFNSLQNISVMTGQDPDAASRMLARLGDLLRAVLRQDSQLDCSLREEVDLAQAYVSIEQVRFGDRLRVEFDVAPDVLDARIPCFLLQPLIENAVVHGLRGLRHEGLIEVSARREGDELQLVVRDNGVGLPAHDPADLKIGVGLGSTSERLARMFPDRQAFSLRQPPEGGTEVQISLPLTSSNAAVRHDE